MEPAFDLSQISTMLIEYMPMFLGLIGSLIAKDFATSMSAGLSFKYNPQFNEGDNVLIDNEPATILKIGFRHTVFSVRKDSGHRTWRYVKNDRIQWIKLEKVMHDPIDPDVDNLE